MECPNIENMTQFYAMRDALLETTFHMLTANLNARSFCFENQQLQRFWSTYNDIEKEMVLAEYVAALIER